jgi:outer membrane protein
MSGKTEGTMRNRIAWACALGALACASPSLAQNPTPGKLTLRQAEDLALKNHPQVMAAQDLSLAAGEQVREVRSAYFPTLNADLTGSQANTAARIGAGALVASRLFDREGQGITFSQLITDSGRTNNLVASSKLQQQAAQQDYLSTRYDVLLAVNQAYFNALQAQAVVKVAQETVAARKQLFDQISALAQNKLRSQLDVNFAAVNLSDAKLLLLRAEDNLQQDYAELARAIGTDQGALFELTEEPLPASPPPGPDPMVAEAFKNRPELASLRLAGEAAHRFAEAEKDLSRPAVTLVGVAGFLPFINTSGIPAAYEGVAVNVDIPILNGHLFAARREAARYRAAAADQRLRDQQLRIARDVRAAWASATTAFQRLDVAAQFVQQAKMALDLAHGRYDLGLSSIVELTQAQLNLTRSEIESLSAKYDYELQHSTLQFSIGSLR